MQFDDDDDDIDYGDFHGYHSDTCEPAVPERYTSHNGALMSNEVPLLQQMQQPPQPDVEMAIAMPNRDPRTRSQNRANVKQTADGKFTDRKDDCDNTIDFAAAAAAEDDDVLNIFCDDDDDNIFDKNSEFSESQPKRARLSADNSEISNTGRSQQLHSDESVNSAHVTVQRPIVTNVVFKIPSLITTNSNSNRKNNNKPLTNHKSELKKTIFNSNAKPSQPYLSTIQSKKINARLPSTIQTKKIEARHPIKQRLGIYEGINPVHLARPVNRCIASVPVRALASVPVPALASAAIPASDRNRIVQESERLMMKINKTDSVATPLATTSAALKTSAANPTNVVQYLMPSFVIDPLANQPVFDYIFKNICRKYIDGKCDLIPSTCQYSHNLPDTICLRKNLDAIGLTKATELYEIFVVRSKKLFSRYAPEFCDYFGTHKALEQLIEMIGHCNHKQRRLYAFFAHIVDGLVKLGMSYALALRKLIVAIKVRTFEANNMILKLILDEKITNLKPFYNVLDAFARQKSYVYPVESINRILRICITEAMPNQEFIQIIWFILTKVQDVMEQRIDPELLAGFYKIAMPDMGTVPLSN